VTLFLNPNASHPLPSDILPRTCTFSVLNNVVTRDVHGFHPVTSFMLISVPDPNEKVKAFAKRYIADLALMRDSETKRAEEGIALRKHRFGEE
jgi:hypothetical protein